ncbi:myb-like domain, Myb/SANT-like DNA-binding domain protein [Artemisia annua]|uniref:Myb-like domain, Myb/SANT-like DNA-binding domain protein n=1 Tax=Artemisia annua TaxID=35608 RepID=A0A2U1M878_ARTAN|nr:myb-like domain, Myb/SANT-like DNA-binding domain protein [Artemisia annua]
MAKAWVYVSTDRKVGNEQSKNSFWDRITDHFKVNVKDTIRTHHSLNTKWKNMNTAMGVFNGLYIQQPGEAGGGANPIHAQGTFLNGAQIFGKFLNCEELINQFAMKNARRTSRIIG